jgi:hypothetical protein
MSQSNVEVVRRCFHGEYLSQAEALKTVGPEE